MMATVSSLKQARQIRQVFGPVLDRLDEVEKFFDHEFKAAQPMVRDVATYVLGNGGKRLRPALVLLVSRMLGYKGERDVRYAAVLEMIHTATLIHDDIIDESDLRRGQPTANNTWGNQTTGGDNRPPTIPGATRRPCWWVTGSIPAPWIYVSSSATSMSCGF